MSPNLDFKSILVRIVDGTCSPEDIRVLNQAVQTGQISVNLRQNNISIGGDILDSVVIIGDGNVVIGELRGAEARALQNIIKETLRTLQSDRQAGAMLEYFRALSVFCQSQTYLALDELISQTKSIFHEVYIPLQARLNSDAAVGAAQKEESVYDVFRQANSKNKRVPLIIFGEPGAGKSTLLQQIAQYALDAPEKVGLDQPYLPMIIRLQTLSLVEGATIEEKLWGAIQKASDLLLLEPPPEGFFLDWPRRLGSSWILLFDGLDEVPIDRRESILRWLNTLIATLGGRGHLIFITSRPFQENDALRSLPHQACDLLPFNDTQARDFVAHSLGQSADSFFYEMERLYSRGLVQTPLLLKIATIVFFKEGCLPGRRTALYNRFINIWLSEAEKHGLVNELGQDLYDIILPGLVRLASAMTTNPKGNTVKILGEVMAKFIHEELRIPLLQAEKKGQRFVEALSRRSGVLIRQGENCGWVHATFREYLNAVHLVDKYWPAEIWPMVLGHWDNKNGQETIRFVFSVLSDKGIDATPFVEKIMERPQGIFYAAQLLPENILISNLTRERIIEGLFADVSRPDKWIRWRGQEPKQTIFPFSIIKLFVEQKYVLQLSELIINKKIVGFSRTQAILALKETQRIDVLLELLKLPDLYQRDQIARAVGESGHLEEARHYFLEALATENRLDHYSSGAIYSLAFLKDVETLWQIARDEKINPRFQNQALLTCLMLNKDDAIKLLLERIQQKSFDDKALSDALETLAASFSLEKLAGLIFPISLFDEIRLHFADKLRWTNQAHLATQIYCELAQGEAATTPELRLQAAEKLFETDNAEIALPVLNSLILNENLNINLRLQAAGLRVNQKEAVLGEEIKDAILSFYGTVNISPQSEFDLAKILDKAGFHHQARLTWLRIANDVSIPDKESHWRGNALDSLLIFESDAEIVAAALAYISDKKIDWWRRYKAIEKLEKSSGRENSKAAWLLLCKEQNISTSNKYQYAEGLLKVGCRAEALEIYESILSEPSTEETEKLVAAGALVRLNQLENVREFIETFPVEKGKKSWELLLEILSKLNAQDRAVSFLEDLLRDDSFSTYEKEKIAKALSELGASEKAIAILKTIALNMNVTQQDFHYAHPNLEIAETIETLGQPAQALEIYQQVRQTSSRDTDRLKAAMALVKLDASEENITYLCGLAVNRHLDDQSRLRALRCLEETNFKEATKKVWGILVTEADLEQEMRLEAAEQVEATEDKALVEIAYRSLFYNEFENDHAYEEKVRIRAACGLVRLIHDENALSYLRKIANNEKATTTARILAISAIVTAGNDELYGLSVLEKIFNESRYYKDDVLQALQSIGTQGAAQLLLNFTETDNQEMSFKSALALSRTRCSAEAKMAWKIFSQNASTVHIREPKILQDLNSLEKSLAIFALTEIGESGTMGEQFRCQAVRQIEQLDGPQRAFPVWKKIITSASTSFVLIEAADNLLKLGEYDLAITGYLKAIGNNTLPSHVREQTLKKIEDLGPILSGPQIIAILGDPLMNSGVHLAALQLLINLKIYENQQIIAFIKHSDVSLRRWAAYGLGTLKVSQGVEALIDTLNDPDQEVQKWCIVSLGQIGDIRAIDPLISKFALDAHFASEIFQALVQMGKNAIEEIFANLENYPSEAKMLRISILHSMAIETQDIECYFRILDYINAADNEFGDEVNKKSDQLVQSIDVDTLTAWLNRGTASQKVTGLSMIYSLINPHEFAPLVPQLLDDKNILVRYLAANLLGDLHTNEAVPTLKKLAREDSDAYVRDAAQSAIEKIKKQKRKDRKS